MESECYFAIYNMRVAPKNFSPFLVFFLPGSFCYYRPLVWIPASSSLSWLLSVKPPPKFLLQLKQSPELLACFLVVDPLLGGMNSKGTPLPLKEKCSSRGAPGVASASIDGLNLLESWGPVFPGLGGIWESHQRSSSLQENWACEWKRPLNQSNSSESSSNFSKQRKIKLFFTKLSEIICQEHTF